MATWQPRQMRWVERDDLELNAADQWQPCKVRVLQQKWVVMNNWAEITHEWRDVPVEEEN